MIQVSANINALFQFIYYYAIALIIGSNFNSVKIEKMVIISLSYDAESILNSGLQIHEYTPFAS